MDTLTPAAPVVRRPRISLWTLRAVITVHVLAAVAQPVLAGLFLTGDIDAIGVHGLIGSLLTLVGMAVIGVALAYVLGGRGRLWVLPVAVLLFLADAFQIAAGYERQLELHIPLGVAIVVVSVLLAAWAWTPSAARPRSRR
ncbi:hypothetical protein ACQPWY_31525 [Pseudonocardia xinjiangensis]|uniref:hypothetical protein n=1 Tax=Pseudonocardia xinjiangensis TaxID=75289 RepID=UPI003D90B280